MGSLQGSTKEYDKYRIDRQDTDSIPESRSCGTCREPAGLAFSEMEKQLWPRSALCSSHHTRVASSIYSVPPGSCFHWGLSHTARLFVCILSVMGREARKISCYCREGGNFFHKLQATLKHSRIAEWLFIKIRQVVNGNVGGGSTRALILLWK